MEMAGWAALGAFVFLWGYAQGRAAGYRAAQVAMRLDTLRHFTKSDQGRMWP